MTLPRGLHASGSHTSAGALEHSRTRFSALRFVTEKSPSQRSALMGTIFFFFIYMWNETLLKQRPSEMHVVLVKM